MYGTPTIRAYTLPFVLFMAFLLVADLVEVKDSKNFWLANPRYLLYPHQTLVCAGCLIYYRKFYSFQWPKRLWEWGVTIGIAVLVLGIWISPQEIFRHEPRLEGFDPTLLKDSPVAYWTTLAFRFLRLVVVVPFLEEIFWRSFLMRYIVADDFEKVRPGTYTSASFGLVAFLFALAHAGPDFWPALACGVLYNGLMLMTGSLGACVIAHAITNLLLGIYIMKTGQWGFW